jgi:hypothetical protein
MHTLLFTLLDLLMEIQRRYATVSENGTLAVVVTPDLYGRIDEAVGSAPCGYYLTAEGEAAREAYRKEIGR